jgi:hypothetical protein
LGGTDDGPPGPRGGDDDILRSVHT